MNRVSLIAIIIILAIPFFSHEKMYSKNYRSDNIDNLTCSTDTIPIIDNNGNGGEGSDPKSSGFVPIVCELLDSGTDLLFSFYANLGYVTVVVTNLYTNDVDSRMIDSQLGMVYFPFSGAPGLYQIIINSSGGGNYYGHFSL